MRLYSSSLPLRFFLFPLLFALAALACGLPNTTPQSEATPVSAATDTSIPPTASALSPTALPGSETPTVAVPTAVEATPTETTPPTATTEPSPAPTQPTVSLPNGFVTVSNTDLLTWRAPDGSELASLNVPNVNGRFVHAASWPTLGLPFAAAYQTYTNEGSVMLAGGGNLWQVSDHPNVLSLAGAPGLPIVAFGTGEWNLDTNQWSSRLYVGDFDTLATSSPLLTYAEPESHYVLPLMVRAEAGAAVGVWFTFEPWGIGGDIVFPPHNGLYFVETAGGSVTEILSQDYNPSTLSPDQTWLAFTGQGFVGSPINVQNLESGNSIQIPLRPESDRGAGYGVFSPDNAYLAWMEGSGSNMSETPNFQAVIRIATLNGQITAELPMSSLIASTGLPLTWVQPVGWLDGETLLVQGRGEDWEDAYILHVRFDGSAAGLLVGGAFAELTYP